MTESRQRMKALIVGAGIAGLATGLMLREWADVTILESASELKEVGAAVTLGPGAVRILRRFGVHLEQEGGVLTTSINVWNSAGVQLASIPFNAMERAGEVNVAVHRADLHSALLRSATNSEGPGVPCEIMLNHIVATVDPDNGVVTTSNGAKFAADVIVGADGIRSVVRQFVADVHVTPKAAGESAYRFLLRPEELQSINHPLLKDGRIPPVHHAVLGPQRKLILYPCRSGEVFNCIAFVPDTELHETTSDKWMLKGNVDAMVQSYKDHDPMWINILKIAKDVGLWQLRDLDPLPNWVKGRAIVIGDAAHPMLPHQASGAMSAIEDAEALSIFLRAVAPSSDTKAINEALQHVFRVRYKRASLCQTRSRAMGLLASEKIGKQSSDELFELWMYPGATQWEVERPDMVLPE